MAVQRNIPYALPGTPERKKLTEESEARVRQACVALMMSAPFFGMLIAYLDSVQKWPEEWPGARSGVPCTAATDGKKIYFNPMFVLSLTHQELCWLLCHEVMHPALGHIARLYDRNPELWNTATDFTVNNTIDDFVKNAKSQAKEWRFIEGGMMNHEYDKLTADAIYDMLMKKQMQQQQKHGGQGQGGQGGSSQGSSQGQKQQQQSGQGQNQGQNQQQQDPNQGGGVSRQQAEDDIRKGLTRMMPNQDAENDPAQREAQEHEWADRLTAAAQTARMQGTMPAGLDRLIDEVLKPIVDWRIILQRFVHDAAKEDYCWKRPNKSYIAGGIYIPGMYSEAMGEVVCIVDDSGSCFAEVPQFISECVAIFESFPGTQLHLISCDTEPTHVLDWEAGNEEPAFEPNVTVRGGGGTSFVKPFDMIQDKEWRPKCVIYLTDLDGEIPDDSRNPSCPVLWVCTNERHSQDELPFGELCVFTGLNKG